MANKKSFLVIGLGRFGLNLIENLCKQKCDILAIDNNAQAVERASQYVEHCIITDATKEANLREIGAQNVDHAIITIGGNIHDTILSTIIAKEIGIPRITVRIDDEYYAQVIFKVGATDVILPEKVAAETLAHQVVSDSILDYYHIKGDYGVVQLKVDSKFKETSLIELDSRNRFDINIVGIIRDNVFFIPKGNDKVKANDAILAIGTDAKVNKFGEFINSKR